MAQHSTLAPPDRFLLAQSIQELQGQAFAKPLTGPS